MSESPKYLDESLSFAERAKDLVSRMTLEEKASQMVLPLWMQRETLCSLTRRAIS